MQYSLLSSEGLGDFAQSYTLSIAVIRFDVWNLCGSPEMVLCQGRIFLVLM